MSEADHSPVIGVDGLTCYQRWEKSDAPYKKECKHGLCISFERPINCEECRKQP